MEGAIISRDVAFRRRKDNIDVLGRTEVLSYQSCELCESHCLEGA